MQPADVVYPPPLRGWWSRNWKWFVPVLGVGMLAICGGCLVGLVGVVFGAIKSSDIYQRSVARAKAAPQVIAALGQPVDDGWMVSGSIQINGSSGTANLHVPLSGP